MCANFPVDNTCLTSRKGVYRIFAIGGSTTIGHKRVEESWPYLLEKKLNCQAGSHMRYEVINLGWWGAYSAHEYYYLVNHDYLHPDLVIVYDGYNDIIYANSQPIEYVLASRNIYGLIEKPSIFYRTKFLLSRHFALANRIYIFLYRFTNKLNRLIVTKRLFGVGSERPIRLFENVEWYRLHQEAWQKTTEITVPPLTEWTKKWEARRISEDTYKTVKRFLTEKGQNLKISDFTKKVLAENVTDRVKSDLLKEIGLGQIEIRIGGLYITRNLLGKNSFEKNEEDLFTEVYQYNLKNMADTLERNGTQGLFIFQPFLSEKMMRLHGRMEEGGYEWIPKNFDLKAYGLFGRFSSGRKAMMQRVANQHHLFFMDAQGIFDSKENQKVYDDMCHYTKYGTAIVVDQIMDYLQQKEIIPA